MQPNSSVSAQQKPSNRCGNDIFMVFVAAGRERTLQPGFEVNICGDWPNGQIDQNRNTTGRWSPEAKFAMRLAGDCCRRRERSGNLCGFSKQEKTNSAGGSGDDFGAQEAGASAARHKEAHPVFACFVCHRSPFPT
jgi:hypothetical protein